MMGPLVSSLADSFSGTLEADGFTTTLSPFDLVSGAAPPAYDQTRTLAAFDKTFDLIPAEANDPTLDKANSLTMAMQATHMVDTASSVGVGVDSIGANGAANLASANFMLADNSLSTLSVLGLSVEGTGIHSDSNSSLVFGSNEAVLSGDASFHSLTVSGALVGGKTLTFSGDAAANTMLYSSPTVTITLDAQTLLLPPAGASGVMGPSITTDAIDIRFNDAKFGGHTISGDFAIGQSSASYALMHV